MSRVDEDGVDHLSTVEAVSLLAERKGLAVASRLTGDPALVIACDSILEFEGEQWGKALTAQEVVTRWTRMRGRTGLLHTGHFLTDTATGAIASEADVALIRFGVPSDDEIEAYATTAESLQVAGPFTLEGRSAPWIASIDGNYGTVTGISLPVLGRLLSILGVEITELWQ